MLTQQMVRSLLKVLDGKVRVGGSMVPRQPYL